MPRSGYGVNQPLHKKAPEFKRRTIQGALGPLQAYVGQASAIVSYNGTPIVVMAATKEELAKVIAEINPRIQPDPGLFMPAFVAHQDAIIELNEEL